MDTHVDTTDDVARKTDQTPVDTILNLYSEWKAVRDRDFPTEEQSQANYRIYAELQEQITSMVAETAQEFAIQLVVETDYGGSDYRESFFEKVLSMANEPVATGPTITIDPDHLLTTMADEIDRLRDAAVIPSRERDKLYHQWLDEAKMAGASLGSVEGMAISERIGHSQKDGEASAFWAAIGELQEQSRHHQPTSLAGLHAKARILRHSMAAEFSDDIPRDDQDWHVLLFNEFMDAVASMASLEYRVPTRAGAVGHAYAGDAALDRLATLLRIARDLANTLDKHIDAGSGATAGRRKRAA